VKERKTIDCENVMGFDAVERTDRRRCKSTTSGVLSSPLSPEATPKNILYVHWGLSIVVSYAVFGTVQGPPLRQH
jgi:hypothetical protein